MRRRDVIRAAGALALGAAPPWAVGAQMIWPQRPLRWVVGYPPGGPSDAFARLIGRAMMEHIGQPVVVDSRPGASGIIATEAMLRLPADGHTLLTTDNAMLVYNPALYSRLPFDPDRDLARVGLIGRFAFFVIVRRDSPFRSFAELHAAGRRAPVAFGSPGIASPHHLAMELLKRRSGFETLDVPYRGMPAVLPELLAGRVDAAVADITSAIPALRSGDARALLVLKETRSGMYPGIPTARELGHDVVADGWQGVCVSKATPEELLDRLAAAMRHAVATPSVAEELHGLGADVVGGDSREFDAVVRADIAVWRPLIRELGLRVDR